MMSQNVESLIAAVRLANAELREAKAAYKAVDDALFAARQAVLDAQGEEVVARKRVDDAQKASRLALQALNEAL